MHEYFHTRFGFCLWDLGALVVLIVMVIVLIVHIIKQKKRESDFEDELSAKMAGETGEHKNAT